MENFLSRRDCLKRIGIGTALMLSHTGNSTSDTKTESSGLAIDRSGVVWGDRPMYLRAYHPPYLVYYYGAIREKKITNRASLIKWSSLVKRVEDEPELVIRIVEAYDDACAGCQKLIPDPLGSVWGVGYSCTSFKQPDVVKDVTMASRRILGELDLYYGSEILMRDLVLRLEKKVPVLYEYIGGNSNQEFYEKGLKYLKQQYSG
ncbi:MAG: hypothetical protein JXB48_22610 [Candidatus Latescibacteria bacterium]|nr:hypothetical protein [Candidatus Latescibacterota bacterium]